MDIKWRGKLGTMEIMEWWWFMQYFNIWCQKVSVESLWNFFLLNLVNWKLKLGKKVTFEEIKKKSSFISILIKISCCKSESGRNQNSDIPLRNLNVVNNWFFRFNLHQDFVWVKDYISRWNLFMHIHQGLAQCTTVVSAQNENLDLPSYTSLYPNNMDNLPNYDSICHQSK